jgi:hypothetical protein
MKFTSAEKTYYSVMTMACGGYYIELISEKATDVEKSKFHETKEERFDFTDFKKPSKEPYPIKVSRATTHITEMIHFYTEVVKGKLLDKKKQLMVSRSPESSWPKPMLFYTSWTALPLKEPSLPLNNSRPT